MSSLLGPAAAQGLTPSMPGATAQRRLLALPAGGELALHLVAFDAARFRPSLFDEAGIARPASVARSVARRQAEFFFGRLAARAALIEQRQGMGDVGKGPAGEPLWPPGLVGSISHVDGLACAVAGPQHRHRGLGVDLERTATGESQAALRQQALDAQELARLVALAGPLSLDELVTLVFSAKESLYKGAYPVVGRFFDFSAARVLSIDPAHCRIVLRLAEDLHPDGFARGRDCELGYTRIDTDRFLTFFEARP